MSVFVHYNEEIGHCKHLKQSLCRNIKCLFVCTKLVSEWLLWYLEIRCCNSLTKKFELCFVLYLNLIIHFTFPSSCVYIDTSDAVIGQFCLGLEMSINSFFNIQYIHIINRCKAPLFLENICVYYFPTNTLNVLKPYPF